VAISGAGDRRNPFGRSGVGARHAALSHAAAAGGAPDLSGEFSGEFSGEWRDQGEVARVSGEWGEPSGEWGVGRTEWRVGSGELSPLLRRPALSPPLSGLPPPLSALP